MKTRQSKNTATGAATRRRRFAEGRQSLSAAAETLAPSPRSWQMMQRRGRIVANKAYRNAQRWMSHAQGETQEAWEEARAQFLEAWADVGELVQKHPAKVMSAAALAGVAFGSLLFRRD